MRRLILAGLFAIVATGAAAQPPSALTLHDLDGATHAIPAEWGSGAGIFVFGFAHGASDAMDRWAEAIAPVTEDRWFEAPVVGDVSALIRPAIRSGMRSRYAKAERRRHVTPVFDGADAARRLATPGEASVVAVAIGADGRVLARVEGDVTAEKVAHLVAPLSTHPS